MKKIDTLLGDIHNLLNKGDVFPDDGFKNYGKEHADVLEQRLCIKDDDGGSALRLSSVGKPCLRQLWYGRHFPLQREALSPSTRLKFLYGDIIEVLLLELVRRSGHLVTGQQDKILVHGVGGHRDCVIDGMLVDVKTASPFSFKKFKYGLERDEDAFGYITQLGSYLLGSKDDALVTNKNEAAFLVVDKVSGVLCLDRHTYTEEDFDFIYEQIGTRKEALANDVEVPERGFEEVPEGKSGNHKLGVNCSYCDFKAHCHEGLRGFSYAGGRPVFLTKVVKEPKVPEFKIGK